MAAAKTGPSGPTARSRKNHRLEKKAIRKLSAMGLAKIPRTAYICGSFPIAESTWLRADHISTIKIKTPTPNADTASRLWTQ